MLLRPKECYSFKNIYLFLCLKVIFDTLGSFWLKNSSDFGKAQFCPELSNFSQFYPILATGEDFSTIVRLLYKPCTEGIIFWWILQKFIVNVSSFDGTGERASQ